MPHIPFAVFGLFKLFNPPDRVRGQFNRYAQFTPPPVFSPATRRDAGEDEGGGSNGLNGLNCLNVKMQEQ